jgi:hypothetical protein
MILIEGLSHFITNFLQNLGSCHTALITKNLYISKTALYKITIILYRRPKKDVFIHNWSLKNSVI